MEPRNASSNSNTIRDGTHIGAIFDARLAQSYCCLSCCPAEDDSMRVLIALLVIAYLVGVGVALAPTIKANWSTGPASQFVESVATELPRALSWPATVYRSIAEKPSAPEKHSAPE
jgi:hypothetical protein